MDLYEFLTSATDAQALKSRVDALCKGRAFGESLTPSMLHCMLGALENGNGDFAADVAAINEEIQVLEDLPSINERKRAYGIHLLMEKTKLPMPAKMLIATGFLRTPLNAAGRAEVHLHAAIPRRRGGIVDMGAAYGRSMARKLQLNCLNSQN